MSHALILTSSVDGHTQAINQRIAELLSEKHRVTHVNIDEQTPPAEYDLVIIGASIRYGKHRPNVAEYINTHRATLSKIPTVFFSVNLVARKPEKNTPETNAYVVKLFDALDWKPTHAEVIAGKLDYPRYGLVDKWMIRFIMWMTKGPTDTQQTTDFTNWQQVDALAETAGELIQS